MASVLFSTVGQAIGGPLGAGVGAALGASVDSRLFRRRARGAEDGFASRSAYGEIVPRVFGRARVGGLLIWALAPGEGSGKGQGRRPQSTSFAMALSRGPVAALGRIWADGGLVRNAEGTFLTNMRMRLHSVGEEQPDPMILAAEGEGAAPAYSNLSYVVCEDFDLGPFGNRIPSLSFEILADDGQATQWLAEMAAPRGASVEGFSPVAAIGGYSALYDPVADDIATLLAAAGGRIARRDGRPAVISEPRLAILPAGEHVQEPTDPESESLVFHSERPTGVSLSFQDSDRDFQLGWQQERRVGRGPMLSTSWPISATAKAARAIAVRLLQEGEFGSETVRITLPIRFLTLCVGDVMQLDEDADWLVVRREIRGLSLQLEGRRIPRNGRVTDLDTDSGRILEGPDQPIPPSVAMTVESPVSVQSGSGAGLMILSSGRAGWRGASVSLVQAGDEISVGAASQPLPFGILVEALGPAPATIWDERSHVLLDVSAGNGLFLGRSKPDVLDGGGLFALGQELVQYSRAELLEPDLMRLSGLLRGRFGTRPIGSAAGAIAMAVPRTPDGWLRLQPDMTGRELSFLVAGRGDPVGGLVVNHSVQGAGHAPLAPVHLSFRRTGDGTVTFSWIARDRNNWSWEQTALGDAQRYVLHYQSDAGQLVMIDASASGVRLDVDAQFAAFGGPLPPGAFQVEALGPGPLDLRRSGWVRV